MGELREQVGELLDWYQQQLNSQEPLKIAKATRRAEHFFDQAEAYLGDAALQLPEDFEEAYEEEPDDGGEDEG